MLYVYLVTVFLTATGVDKGPELYMGSSDIAWSQCEALSRQFTFTQRPPQEYLGIAHYCEVRKEGPTNG